MLQLIANTIMVCLQKEEEGFDHQISKMPSAPSPDTVTKTLQSICMKFSIREMLFRY